MTLTAQHFSYLSGDGAVALAHRGGAAMFVENTYEAFQGAYQLGYRYMETDVHLTRDGVVIAFHDAVLDRVSELSGKISDYDWSQLAELKIQGVARIPSMRELLTSMPDVNFNIDMKCDEVVQPLVELIKELNAVARVCLASFVSARLKFVRGALGETLCTSASRREVIQHFFRSKGLPLPVVPAPVLQVPESQYGITIVNRGFVDCAHQDGKQVHVWTVDEEQDMRRLLDLGVDGIISDQPLRLKQVLKSLNSKSEA